MTFPSPFNEKIRKYRKSYIGSARAKYLLSWRLSKNKKRQVIYFEKFLKNENVFIITFRQRPAAINSSPDSSVKVFYRNP